MTRTDSATPRFCVLGAGSWGTALASHLSACGHTVTLWGRCAESMACMQASGCNERYLPGYPLNSSLRFSSDLESALKHSTEVLVSVPSHSFASMIDCINRYATADCRVMWACKGFAPDSYKLLSDVVAVQRPQQECAVVSGPSFAAELVQGLPTAITVAASTQRHALQVSQWFQSDYFRAYPTDDIRGVQLGGALKNIYAIAAGISDGLGFGANARAALITRGLAELMRLADMLGARRDTLMGLSGMGDLILTCTDDKSRNRRFGLAIAQGLSVDQALDQIGQSVEGVAATTAARKLAGDNTIELPIVEQLHCVLQEGKAAGDAVSALLSREIKTEFR